MIQPISGFNWSKLSGTLAGTTTVCVGEHVFDGVHFGTTTTGTVTFYDSESGTNAYPMFTAVNNATTSSNTNIHVGVRRGITATKGGTVDCLVTWH